MKRSTFLMSVFGFLGIARAQQWKEVDTDGNNCLSLDTDGTGGNLRSIPCGNIGKRKPALNNQCPVCGAMAPPYHSRPPCGTFFDKRGNLKSYTAHVICGDDYKTGPVNLTRCPRCNAAFWQDSEDKK